MNGLVKILVRFSCNLNVVIGLKTLGRLDVFDGRCIQLDRDWGG